MEWQQLVSFQTIVKLGSMTRAAEATFRTQSALSQQIARLEEELNCKLFHRIGKSGFRLTSEGEVFYQFAEETLQREQALFGKLEELSGKNAGSIRLAAPYAIMYFLLPDILEKYAAAYPNVELRLMQKTPQECIDMVTYGAIDFCVSHQSTIPRSMRSEPWHTGYYMLVAPKGHPVTRLEKVEPEDLARYPLNLPEKNAKFSARDKISRMFEEQGLKYKVALETPNVLLSLRYAMMGIGLSFMLCYKPMIDEFSDRLDFIPMSHIFPDETIAVAMRKDSWLPQFKLEFLQTLIEQGKAEGVNREKPAARHG